MNRNQVMEQARAIGWVVKPSHMGNLIGVRSHKADSHERMRIGSSGQLYTTDDEGWAWQWGTVSDVAKAIKAKP